MATMTSLLSLFALAPGAVRDEALLHRFSFWNGVGLSLWWLALIFLTAIVVIGLGVVLGYHRLLTHKSAKLSPWLERLIVTAGLPAGTPAQWVGNHRHHHVASDTIDDAHSPMHHGFWVAHAGWYLGTHSTFLSVLYAWAGPARLVFDAFYRPRTNQEHVSRARDIFKDPYYAWLSRPGPYGFMLLSYFALLVLLFGGLFGLQGLLLLWPTVTFFYFVGDLVNSACHRSWIQIGNAPFRSGDQSRNVWWLFLLTLGDCYHNAHHAFGWSARCGLLPGQLDLAYLFLKGCERLGWAHDIKEPSPAQIAERLVDEDQRALFLAHCNTSSTTVQKESPTC